MTDPGLYRIDPPVWLLDVDGVINAGRAGWGRAPVAKQVYCPSLRQSFRIRWEPALLERIKAMHALGVAEVRWCTTWAPDATELEAALRMPHLEPCWTTHINGLEASAAKLARASAVLAEGRRLIWTDDREVPLEGEYPYDEMTADGRALLIRPNAQKGLRPEHLRDILEFCLRLPEPALTESN